MILCAPRRLSVRQLSISGQWTGLYLLLLSMFHSIYVRPLTCGTCREFHLEVSDYFNNNKKKKKIHSAQIVMNHESEVRAVTRWPGGVC